MPKKMDLRRSFKVVYTSHGVIKKGKGDNEEDGEEEGRFVSTTPYAAARKAARRLFSEAPGMRGFMQIQEITRGSKQRVYSYASIIEADNRIVKFTNKLGKVLQISKKYKVRVSKMTEIAFAALLPGAKPTTMMMVKAKPKPKSAPGPNDSDSDDEDDSDVLSESDRAAEAESDVSSEDEPHEVAPAAGGGMSAYY